MILILIKIKLLTSLFFISLFSYGQGEFLSVCDRTPQVKEAIMRMIAKIDPSITCSDDDLMLPILSSIKTLTVISVEERGVLDLFFGDWFSSSLKVGDFSGLSSLESLFLSSNQISSLSSNAFLGLSSLTHLDLQHNDISSLHANTFSGLSSLESLFLFNNQISSVPEGIFFPLTSLKTIDFSHNPMSKNQKTLLTRYFRTRGVSLRL